MKADIFTKALEESKKRSCLLQWNVHNKMSWNTSAPEDGILFAVFWNMFMLEVKKKTKSMNKIKDA